MIISQLHLENNAAFSAQTPELPSFCDDELEIWFSGANKKICLFKDSFLHVFRSETAFVLSKFEESSDLDAYIKGNRFSTPTEAYFVNAVNGAYSVIENFHSNILFECKDCIVWLLHNEIEGHICVEISTVRPYDDIPGFEVEARLCIDKSKFFGWLYGLMGMVSNILSG